MPLRRKHRPAKSPPTARKPRPARGTHGTHGTPGTPGTRGKHGTKSARRWSSRVTRNSNALDLEPGVFTQRSARQVALSLQRSAEASHRRKSEPYRSAMSMLTFHLNRGGAGLSAERRRVLNQAKVELRKVFHRA